ncbi:hypothetical protein B0H12DRAFT_1067222 [Mycena haematopus]|nr:hypothetical protein B0H12DRAFT_1067222 [Mycena haematopus]
MSTAFSSIPTRQPQVLRRRLEDLRCRLVPAITAAGRNEFALERSPAMQTQIHALPRNGTKMGKKGLAPRQRTHTDSRPHEPDPHARARTRPSASILKEYDERGVDSVEPAKRRNDKHRASRHSASRESSAHHSHTHAISHLGALL